MINLTITRPYIAHVECNHWVDLLVLLPWSLRSSSLRPSVFSWHLNSFTYVLMWFFSCPYYICWMSSWAWYSLLVIRFVSYWVLLLYLGTCKRQDMLHWSWVSCYSGYYRRTHVVAKILCDMGIDLPIPLPMFYEHTILCYSHWQSKCYSHYNQSMLNECTKLIKVDSHFVCKAHTYNLLGFFLLCPQIITLPISSLKQNLSLSWSILFPAQIMSFGGGLRLYIYL